MWKKGLPYKAGVASKMSFGSGRIWGNLGKSHQVRPTVEILLTAPESVFGAFC